MMFILSANLVTIDIKNEVGDISWSQLPVANYELFKHQIFQLKASSPKVDIAIVFGHDNLLSEHQINWLTQQNISIVNVDKYLSSGQQLYEALHQLDSMPDSGCGFLFGSTLPIGSNEFLSDWYTVFYSTLEPNLPIVNYGYHQDLVWAGFGNVTRAEIFSDILKEEHYDLKRAMDRYSFNYKTEQKVSESIFTASSLSSYFHMRSVLTSERAFNTLTIQDNVIKKHSLNQKKLQAESNWFEKLPMSLKHYVPSYLGSEYIEDKFTYSLEYIGAFPLNESFVHGRHTIVFWKSVFVKMQTFLKAARTKAIISCPEIPESSSAKGLLISKTLERLVDIESFKNINCDKSWIINGVKTPSLRNIVKNLSVEVLSLKESISIIHGDFCLSNILYDSRTRALKIIDPRGMDAAGQDMIYGSQIYDVLKLYHSIIGLYDHIIGGRYTLKIQGEVVDFSIETEDDVKEIQEALIKIELLESIPNDVVIRILPLLFISMIPLHKDNPERQLALCANALRLFAEHPSIEVL